MIFQSKKYGMPGYLLVLCLVFTLTASGCAVLTPSQVAEVREFAKGTKKFYTLPGDVITAYRDIRKEGIMLALATNTYVDKESANYAWENILNAREFSSELTAQAEKLNKSLGIMDRYAQLLLLLSSDEFRDEFGKSTLQLSRALDKGVQEYNEIYTKDFKQIGSSAAGIIGGIGGIYIRRKQAKLLKLYVQEADSMIKVLTLNIESLMNPFLDKSDKVQTHLQAELDKIKGLFITEAVQSRNNLQLSTLRSVAEMIEKIEDAKKLAKICKSSAVKYREAHFKPKQSLDKKQTIKGRIAEVQSLVDEIKIAVKLKKSLEN